jgi:DNA (cytosine-5)-methyltransferase 1
MLNGLDLFSGIGGLSIALNEWVRPIAYCEIDTYCQGVLCSNMSNGRIRNSPIWDDIRSFPRHWFHGIIDIIYGGFPCQDISVAGHGKGLEGERSGLFFEIVRLAKEIKPTFIFLENVPAITSRGGLRVVREITKMGYDCRWCVISAASIGALHRRERWFLLGYSQHSRSHASQERGSSEASIHQCTERQNEASESQGTSSPRVLASEFMANSQSERSQEERQPKRQEQRQPMPTFCGQYASINSWQEAVSSICRVTDGIPLRSHRIKSLGNAVVPEQAKEAFKILMGLND